MTRSILFTAAGAGAFALAACNQVAPGAPATDTAAVADAVRAAEAQSLQDWQARSVDGVVATFTPDGSAKYVGTSLMKGADAIKAGLTPFLADKTFTLEFKSDEVRVSSSGDLASSRGSYTVGFVDPATKKPTTEKGTYLAVWQKQVDGRWKMLEDMTSAEPAAAPAQASQ